MKTKKKERKKEKEMKRYENDFHTPPHTISHSVRLSNTWLSVQRAYEYVHDYVMRIPFGKGYTHPHTHIYIWPAMRGAATA